MNTSVNLFTASFDHRKQINIKCRQFFSIAKSQKIPKDAKGRPRTCQKLSKLVKKMPKSANFRPFPSKSAKSRPKAVK